MNTRTKFILLFSIITIGLGFILWGSYIMWNYEGYREIVKAARNEALPQLITGFVILVIGYVLTYKKIK